MIDCTSLPSFGSIVPNGPLIIVVVVVDDDVVDDGYETLFVDRHPCIVLREQSVSPSVLLLARDFKATIPSFSLRSATSEIDRLDWDGCCKIDDSQSPKPTRSNLKVSIDSHSSGSVSHSLRHGRKS